MSESYLEQIRAHVESGGLNPYNARNLLDEVDRLRAERTEMLAELHKRYVSDDIVKLVQYAMRDIASANETVCRLRGETDADADLKRFVNYVDHAERMSPGEVSLIIDFAQGQKARAEKAEADLACAAQRSQSK